MQILLLPGLDGTGELFDEFAAALRAETGATVRVVPYPIDLASGYDAYLAYVRALLPVSESYVLLGESFGGPIAIALAAESPPGLEAVILSCACAVNPVRMLPGLRFLMPVFPFKALPRGLMRYLTLGRHATPELLERIRAAVHRVPSRTLSARAQAVATVDLRQKLRTLRIPVLYLRATEDRMLPKRNGDLINALAPDCQLVDFDAPHFLLQVLPEACAKTIRRFVLGLPSFDRRSKAQR